MSKKKPYRYLLYLLLCLLEWLCIHLPRKAVLGIIEFVGKIVWRILPKERKKVLTHLKVAFPDKSEQELSRIGQKVFQNLGRVAVDTLRIPLYKKNNSKDELIIADGDVFKKIEQALASGKGLIFLTGHIGNWELITFYITEHGYPGTIIGRKIYYEPFNRILERVRASTGTKIVYTSDSPKEILKALRKNETIGILPDQDVDSIEGIFVPFFGKPAYTPVGPAKISLVSGAPILPVFMVREGDQYRLIAKDLIEPNVNANREEEAVRITKEWSSVIESVIREYPEQWVWMHRRWKTQPNVKEELVK